MKYSSILLLCTGFSIIPLIHSSQGSVQNFDTDLNGLQQSLNMLVAQSNLDPVVAQNILDKTNAINQQLQNNIQRDLLEIQIAAGISSLLETSTAMAQATNMTKEYNILNSMKQSAHANSLRTLLIGAYRGNLTDPTTYTDPYTESIGFIINNWILSPLLQAGLTAFAATPYGQTIVTAKSLKAHQLLIQAIAAIAAQCVWSLEKKLFFLNIYQNTYQTFFNTAQNTQNA
jgi:hypothetical protein